MECCIDGSVMLTELSGVPLHCAIRAFSIVRLQEDTVLLWPGGKQTQDAYR